MAASPRFKVFNADGVYVASCKFLEDAAALVAFNGAGAQIRDGHTRIIWSEGSEMQPAAESYDYVVKMAQSRCFP